MDIVITVLLYAVFIGIPAWTILKTIYEFYTIMKESKK